MVSSGYVTLAGFLAAMQLIAATWAIAVGLRSLAPKTQAGELAADRLESNTYLAGMLAYLLLGMSLASWLVFYLVLNSFVPQWPGAMCIYGVTQIGEGSRGMFGWLPRLVLLEQAMKPVLVFATGAALVLYRFYRRQGTRALLPRVAGALLVAAVVASVDATTELAYLSIPKRDNLPSSGCCSVSAEGREHEPLPGPQYRQQLEAAYYACQAVMAALVWRVANGQGERLGARRLLPLLVMAAVTLWVSMRFLIDVASPKLLHLPYHRCLYDLVPGVPESGVALLLLLGATFCVGWAALISALGRCPDAAAELRTDGCRWCSYALLGYVGSTAMISFDLWLA